jgi:DNA-directed RNA polymerase delta subunit.
MKLSEIPKEELELMGYDDIAWYIINESGKKVKLVDVFKKVLKTLEKNDNYSDDQLLEFFELMSTNKKFIMLKNGYWDLQSRHNEDLMIEDIEEEEFSEEIEEEIDDEIEEEDEDIFYDEEDETADVEDDDLEDLVVIDENEEETSL